MIGGEVAVSLQVKRIYHEARRIERDRPVCTCNSQQLRRQVVSHRNLNRVRIRERPTNTVVTKVVRRNRNHTAAQRQVLHSFQRGIDAGNASRKGHQRVISSVPNRECQAGGAVQSNRAVGSLQRHLHRITAGIHVRNKDRIRGSGREDEQCIKRYILRAGHVIDRRVVDRNYRHRERLRG